MPSFVPARVLIDRDALGYPLGARLADAFAGRKIPVAVYDGREFQTCRPSANYQLPLVSGCPGLCQ